MRSFRGPIVEREDLSEQWPAERYIGHEDRGRDFPNVPIEEDRTVSVGEVEVAVEYCCKDLGDELVDHPQLGEFTYNEDS